MTDEMMTEESALHENVEIIDGIPTLDEIIADPYYKAEFDKKVAEALNIQNTHSEVKGGNQSMNGQVQTIAEGELTKQDDVQAAQEPQTSPLAAAENPAAEITYEDTAQQGNESEVKEPAREMTPEQFDLYNETLRRVSKTAKASLPSRYNAFEDVDVKMLVKQQVMQGETPSVKELAASVVQRLTSKDAPSALHPSAVNEETAKDVAAEILDLKAENALLKAGITAERIDAAKKLFKAEGAIFDKIDDFVEKYPEWQSKEGVVFGKAPPLVSKTAPNPDGQPVLNDFERRVQEVRKARGYK